MRSYTPEGLSLTCCPCCNSVCSSVYMRLLPILLYLYSDDADLLPVLVYIHGGGSLQYGSGHDELLSPSAHLSKEINSVVVSFNYRLGIFGWLAVQVTLIFDLYCSI